MGWSSLVPTQKGYGIGSGDGEDLSTADFTGNEYDMQEFVAQCVERLCELPDNPASSLKSASTPCSDDKIADDEEREETRTKCFRCN